jgi:hypothetical protein
MVVPNQIHKGPRGKRLAVRFIAGVLALILEIELTIVCAYFTLMSLLMITNLTDNEDWRITATASHMVAALLYFVSMFGVILCFFGLIANKTPIKCLLLALSIVGMAVLPVDVYLGFSDGQLHELIYYLAELSALMFVTTLAAFYFMEIT